MSRCTAKEPLEVHHKRRYGGNGIENARILCQPCHEKTDTYGEPGNSPPDFSQETKNEALKRAGYRCECEQDNCHISEEEWEINENREINEVLIEKFSRS